MTVGMVQAQQHADDIIGYYFVKDPFTDEGIQIYIDRTNTGKYEGKVTWVEKEESKSFIGLIFMKDLTYNAKDHQWVKGTVKYPGKKGNFSVNMQFQNPDTLKVRGYWGVAMMGKTLYWPKEKQKRVQK